MAEPLLVVVFLRGGADGMALVPPVGDIDYHRLRPNLGQKRGVGFTLDGTFALHYRLSALAGCWRQGQLAVIPAVGSDDRSRSHFQSQDHVEAGGTDVAGGWLGRWLRATGAHSMQALAMGTTLPSMLAGAPGACAASSLAGGIDSHLLARWSGLYALDPDLAAAAGDASRLAQRLLAHPEERYTPAPSARYGDDAFSRQLRRLAQFRKEAMVNLRAACLDLRGWDSHIAQEDVLGDSLDSLGTGLAAFVSDLGPLMSSTTVVVLSEFGRRAAENSALGTDHGTGGTMLILGNVLGGVHGRWPGLSESALCDGDVAITTDYRAVLAGLLARLGGGVAEAFPHWQGQTLAL